MGVLTQIQREIYKKGKKSTSPGIFCAPYHIHGICAGRSLKDAAETHSKYKYLNYVIGTATTNYDELLTELCRGIADSDYNQTRTANLEKELELDRSQLYSLSLATKIELQEKVRFLEAELRADRPYSQLYKLGAGGLFVAVISLVFWIITGIGAPFHPIFSAAVIPVSLGLIVMAFLIRHEKRQPKNSEKNTRTA
jgi:hypothetical protein